MSLSNRPKTLLVLVACSLLAACVTAPRPLQGQFSTLRPEEIANRQAQGETVRWGGRIVSVLPQANRSCFEIVAAPLGDNGRPRRVDHSDGRFIACRAGFYEPEVFAAGREVTVTGHVEGMEVRKVGDYDYRYPRVSADVVYLWPEYQPIDARTRFYGGMGFGRGWGFGMYPYWW